MKQCDTIVIGFDKGGKTLAAELAKRGWKVILIERSVMMYGGTCPSIACVPTERLIHGAEKVSWLYPASYERQAEAYKATIAWKNEMTATSGANMFDELNSLLNVTIYTGMASFVSKDVVKITLPDEMIEPQGRKIFINTGSTDIISAIDGPEDSKRVYANISLMKLDVLPRHLVIVGGGYIGPGPASMCASFGSKVTVFEGGDKFVAREDRDIANTVKEAPEKKGIEVRLSTHVQSIRNITDGVILAYTDTVDGTSSDIEGDTILVAAGRKPMIEGLNLQAAGVEVDSHGAIVVGGYLHTTSPNIWAMGDVKGGLQFTYISLDDYRIIRDSLFGSKEHTADDRNPVAYSVFMDPPLSHIGLTEEEAIRRGHSSKVSRLPASALPCACALQQTDGILKAIIDSHSGHIMGCALFCVGFSEVISIVNIAVKTEQHYTFLHDFIFTHPNMDGELNELFSIDQFNKEGGEVSDLPPLPFVVAGISSVFIV